jgi:hypothetical protein
LHEKDVFEKIGGIKYFGLFFVWFVAILLLGLLTAQGSAILSHRIQMPICSDMLSGQVYCKSMSPKNKIPITGSNIN